MIEDEEIITKSKKQDGRLLFIHQTAWQSRLLARYGNDLTFLDATYKTTKYALPLFFIAVKTNVDHAIVGSFIVQDETTQSITEALTIIKQWNPQWKPSYFMTDLCEEEINSIETIFPGNFMLPKYIYFVIKNLNTIHTFYAIFSHVYLQIVGCCYAISTVNKLGRVGLQRRTME